MLLQIFGRVVLPFPQMIRKLHTILVEQTEYQRVVPMVRAALLFKEIYARGAGDAEPSTTDPGEIDDARSTIDAVMPQFEKHMYAKYVETGKRSAEVFKSYLLALRLLLTDVFVNGDSEGTSYFEYLKQHIPNLSKSTYLKHHRSIFEYLAKNAKEQVARRLKE